MWLGELIPKSMSHVDKEVQYKHISFDSEKSMLIHATLRYHKTNDSTLPTSLHLYENPNTDLCPLQTTKICLSKSLNAKGSLFQLKSEVSVFYHFVTNSLRSTLVLCGLNPINYKGHSFRIEAATDAAGRRLSDTAVQKLGRWKSNVF